MAANIIIVIVWLRMLLQREVSFDQRSVHTPEPPNEKRSAAEAVACKCAAAGLSPAFNGVPDHS